MDRKLASTCNILCIFSSSDCISKCQDRKHQLLVSETCIYSKNNKYKIFLEYQESRYIDLKLLGFILRLLEYHMFFSALNI
jgi:hypothetical protein